jgi:hypothetical protein
MNAAGHLDDTRLSALLDGEGAASDAAHAAQCPDCGHRLAVWEEARRLVATPPEPAPPAQRDAAVAAALAQRDAAVVATRPAGPVMAWEDDRRRRRVPWGRIAAAAAAVVVVAGAATAIVRSGGGSSSSTASKSASAGPASTGAPSAGAGAPSGSSAATNEPGPGPAQLASLGAMPGPDPLVARLRSTLAALAAAPPAGPAPSAGVTPEAQAVFRSCLLTAASGAGVPLGTPPVMEASLIYQGVPAAVFVFEVGALHVAEVTAESGCGGLARLPF